MIENPLDRFTDKQIADVCSKLAAGIVSAWRLSESESATLLGIDNLGKVFAEQHAVPDLVIERLSLLVGIDRAACSLLSDRERATLYLRKPNSSLDGLSAMTIMLQGSVDNLYAVRRFLEAKLV